MTSKEIALRYFNSWQEPINFQELADCLSDDFKINSGFFAFNDKDNFVQFIASNLVPWENVQMLSSFFGKNFAAILYEGINTANNKKMRISEHILIKNGKIREVHTVIAQLN